MKVKTIDFLDGLSACKSNERSARMLARVNFELRRLALHREVSHPAVASVFHLSTIERYGVLLSEKKRS